MLKKEFKRKDVNRARNLIMGKTGPKHINLKMTRAKLEALVEDVYSSN